MSKDFRSMMKDWAKKKNVDFSSTGWGRISDTQRLLDKGSIDAETAINNFLSGEKYDRRSAFSDKDIKDMAREIK